MIKCPTVHIKIESLGIPDEVCDQCVYLGSRIKCASEQWRLLEDVWYILDDGRYLVVRAGFCFDGASIPRLFRTLIGDKLDQRFLKAALLHDILYISHFTTRSVADGYFLDLLVPTTNWFQRNTMWTQLRLWGWTVYNSHSVIECNHFKQFVDRSAVGQVSTPQP